MAARRLGLAVGVAVLTVAAAWVSGQEEERDASQIALARAKEILAGSAKVVAREPYSKTIPHLFVGYDANGVATQGVAMRSFKTYEWVTALISVKREGDRFVVATAEIPDLDVIRNPKKQDIVSGAIDRIKGQVVRDESQAAKTIDAVTGATRYHKRIYVYFDNMAKALVQEMTAPPAPAPAK
jgi:hypothetical protein